MARRFSAPKDVMGQVVDVKITEALLNSLRGECDVPSLRKK